MLGTVYLKDEDGTSKMYAIGETYDVSNAEYANLKDNSEKVSKSKGDEEEEDKEPEEKALSRMNREELNAKALSLGIETPESMENNKAVIKAIEEKQAEQG